MTPDTDPRASRVAESGHQRGPTQAADRSSAGSHDRNCGFEAATAEADPCRCKWTIRMWAEAKRRILQHHHPYLHPLGRWPATNATPAPTASSGARPSDCSSCITASAATTKRTGNPERSPHRNLRAASVAVRDIEKEDR